MLWWTVGIVLALVPLQLWTIRRMSAIAGDALYAAKPVSVMLAWQPPPVGVVLQEWWHRATSIGNPVTWAARAAQQLVAGIRRAE